MKGLLVILDGMGDRKIRAFGDRTPLEAARTENFDALVAAGECGLVDPVTPGVVADTHTGAGALMGVPPEAVRTLARGPIEAAGIGMDLVAGDIALRGNFATLAPDNDGFLIRDRRAGRIDSATEELAAALDGIHLDGDITATLRSGTQHRTVLRLSGSGLSAAISDTDPGAAGGTRALVCKPLRMDDEAAARTANALNEFLARSFERLSAHPVNREREARGQPPANGILTRNAGRLTDTPSLVQILGLRAAIVAGEKTMLGLGKTLGYDVVTDPRFTSMPDTDLAAKIDTARRTLENHDLVVLHIKGTDICSHDRDPVGKREMIERIDTAIGPIIRDDIVIGVSCDHSTDSSTGAHCCDPVPSLLRAPGLPADACSTYGEDTCARGGLGRIPATSFFRTMLDRMGVEPNQSLAGTVGRPA